MTKYGRQLGIGPTDNTSNERTPRNKLNLIPEAARTSFVPYAPRAHSINLAEADMTRIAPGRPRASGEAIKVSGKLTDEYGRPIRNALIEIWNANQHGGYTHDEDHSGLPIDQNFLGIGRTLSSSDGNYEFWKTLINYIKSLATVFLTIISMSQLSEVLRGLSHKCIFLMTLIMLRIP